MLLLPHIVCFVNFISWFFVWFFWSLPHKFFFNVSSPQVWWYWFFLQFFIQCFFSCIILQISYFLVHALAKNLNCLFPLSPNKEDAWKDKCCLHVHHMLATYLVAQPWATSHFAFHLLVSYIHVTTKVTCTWSLLTWRTFFFLDSSSEDDKKKVGNKLPAKQPMIKNTSKPAKVVVKPGQAKKDSSSSSDSSGIRMGEKENFYVHVVLVQTSVFLGRIWGCSWTGIPIAVFQAENEVHCVSTLNLYVSLVLKEWT